jgi:hypothetical protein
LPTAYKPQYEKQTKIIEKVNSTKLNEAIGIYKSEDKASNKTT